ncbi:hypothetical protein BGZ52_007892 [Haplosporangium bisporale]|nr:hypothetical protein BGZ52_007892 [Haplosporangium bisporale]
MPALIVSPALPPEQEETKDRSSIKLMDLPMTKKKNPVLEDTTATGAGGVTSTATASTVPANTKQAASKQQQPSKSLPTIQASQKTTNTSSSSSELTFTEDSSFSEGQDQLDPDQDQDDQTPRHRVGNPPHYETREERQIRIRRQFNQLDGKRSGYVDANSLVSFFAEVTPDVNVQKRYADELLQLCHTRKLHRNSGVNNSNSSNKDVSSSSGTEASLSGAGSADQEELNPKRHNGLVHYADFQIFVEEKEERLWNLFREIDHNNDNEIQADELQASLAKAGIDLSDADLQQFIKAMDKDGDGAIDYEEWRDFLVVITAPLDRLKVYLITNSTPALTGPAASTALKHIPKFTSPSSAVAAPVRQRLLWSAITDLYQAGGIKTFFRGNGLNIIKIAPESAIKFYTYETSKWFIATHLSSLTVQPIGRSGSSSSKGTAHVPEIATSGRFLAGGIAGLVSQFSIYPLETIKTRIMASTGGVKGSSSSGVPVKLCIRTVAREMWQKAGIRGFYRGLGPSLIGIFPYAAIDLSVFETLKFGYLRWKAGLQEGAAGSEEKSLERPSVFVLLACGTISGSVGATSVYPLSLVRTRLQAQGTPQHPQTYTSTLDVFRKTFEKDGIRGFYKGMVPTLTKVVPAVSISYVVYEYSKRELGL